jgi:hypothetical protein
MRQDDMVENTEKLAWGARGRRFKSSHSDFFSKGFIGILDENAFCVYERVADDYLEGI